MSLAGNGRGAVLAIVAFVLAFFLSIGLTYLIVPDFPGILQDSAVELFTVTDGADQNLAGAITQHVNQVLAAAEPAYYLIFVFASLAIFFGLLCAVLVGLLVYMTRHIAHVERSGLLVGHFNLNRAQLQISINDMDFKLTEAAYDTLEVLAEARLDDEILSGAALEAAITGKEAANCEESTGAVRVKRLRDQLGNGLVSQLLVRSISGKGYTLSVNKTHISIE